MLLIFSLVQEEKNLFCHNKTLEGNYLGYMQDKTSGFCIPAASLLSVEISLFALPAGKYSISLFKDFIPFVQNVCLCLERLSRLR